MDKVVVQTLQELQEALAGSSGLIEIGADISGIDTLNVTRSCQIVLNGHTLTSSRKTVFLIHGEGVVVEIVGDDLSEVHGTIICGWKDGDGCTVKIYGGMYVATVADEPAIQTNGLCQNVTLEVENAVCLSTDDTFYLAGGGVTTLTRCRVNGNTGIYAKGSKITLVDTSIVADGPAADPQPNGNGASSTGDAIIMDAKSGYTGAMELVVDEKSVLMSKNRNAVCETYTDATKTAVHKVVLKGLMLGPVTASSYFKEALDSGNVEVDFDEGTFMGEVAPNCLPEGKVMIRQIDGSYACRSEDEAVSSTYFGKDIEVLQAKGIVDDIKFMPEKNAEPLAEISRAVRDYAQIDALKGFLKPATSMVNKILDILKTAPSAWGKAEEMKDLQKKALQVYFTLYRVIETGGEMK